jgi:hypothetical protein
MSEDTVNVIVKIDEDTEHHLTMHHIPRQGEFFSYWENLHQKYFSDPAKEIISGKVLGVRVTYEFTRLADDTSRHTFDESTFAEVYLKPMTEEEWLKEIK